MDKTIIEDIVKKDTGHSTKFAYKHDEIAIAAFAMTKLVQNALAVGHPHNLEQEPTTIEVSTDINTRTKINFQVTGVFSEGVVSADIDKNAATYFVSFLAKTKKGLETLTNRYFRHLEKSNYYRGKCLYFGKHHVEFVKAPEVDLKDVVLPEKIVREIKLNVLDFLTDPDLYTITKKRGLIFYGPPGSGKTSTVSGIFNYLLKKGITCVYVTSESFRHQPISAVFSFINKYLSPAVLVFEDVDLVGYSRDSNLSNVIGPLLSALNGIDAPRNPIVVIGTTNRIDVLDKAVTRPCRFDRKLHIDYPDERELKILFKKFVGEEPPERLLQQKKITGAHVREIANTMKLLQQKKGGSILDYAEEAIDTVVENFHVGAGNSIGFTRSSDEDDECEVSLVETQAEPKLPKW